ncbi:MAG: hypothetical protein H0T60_10270 [Acidobacteria bacterium]|nr:hypothetical protein [Acidobacteriota bacterium]
MMSSNEYALELEKFSSAIARIPELESLVAQANGKLTEAQAYIERLNGEIEEQKSLRKTADLECLAAKEIAAEMRAGLHMMRRGADSILERMAHRNAAVDAETESMGLAVVRTLIAEPEKPASTPIETAGAKPAKPEKIAA